MVLTERWRSCCIRRGGKSGGSGTLMADFASLPYRLCAGMTVINRDGFVFIGRRKDLPEQLDADHAWQMPQGGIAENEDPYEAALRELYEETNIRSVEKLGEIHIVHPAGGRHAQEFVAWRWADINELPKLVVPFKRPTYERVVAEFGKF